MEATLEKRIEELEHRLSLMSMRISLLESNLNRTKFDRCLCYIPNRNSTSNLCKICGKTKQEHLI